MAADGAFRGQDLAVRNEPRPDMQTRLEQVAQRLEARFDVLEYKLSQLLRAALQPPVA